IQDLNAKDLIDAFADKGLVCAVIKPERTGENSGLIRKTENAAHRADIVILDWQIGDEEEKGDKAIELIKAITKADENLENGISPKRLRLLAIYTSDPDTEAISKKIRDALNIKKPGKESAVIESDA